MARFVRHPAYALLVAAVCFVLGIVAVLAGWATHTMVLFFVGVPVNLWAALRPRAPEPERPPFVMEDYYLRPTVRDRLRRPSKNPDDYR